MQSRIAEGLRAYGETVQVNASGVLAYSIREPLGVVGIITPWNFPVNVPVRKCTPALVAGNTCVFKPASLTPQTGLRFVELFHKAGLPPGVLTDMLDPAFREANPWHPSMETGLVLEKAKIPPGPVQAIVNLALLGLLAQGTGELGAFDEVEPEIESIFFLRKLQINSSLKLGQSRGQGKQGVFIQRGVSFLNWNSLGCYHALIVSLDFLNPHEIEKNRFFN